MSEFDEMVGGGAPSAKPTFLERAKARWSTSQKRWRGDRPFVMPASPVSGQDPALRVAVSQRTMSKKVRPNEPCPCGSGEN